MTAPEKSIDARLERLPLVFERTFAASPETVFAAWTQPERVAQWWGPHQFTNPVCELTLRLGGPIRIDMQSPEGTIYPMTGSYEEIIQPRWLSFRSAALDEAGRALFEVLTEVEITGHKDHTHQTVTASVIMMTPEAEPYLAGMEEGWAQSLERLETYLASQH